MASPGPNFIISPCVPADIEQMISVYTRAFANDYFSRFTFPPSQISPETKHQWLAQRFRASLTKPEMRNFKITDGSTGDIAAWGRWQFPHTFSAEEKAERRREKERREEEGVSEWPEGANLEVCEVKFGGLESKRDRYVDWENTYVVYLLQTDPAYQRKGLASRLLKHALALADAEGRKTYIEATAEGHPVYLKLGFRDIDVLTVDLSKWGGKEPAVSRIMMRDPQPNHEVTCQRME